MFETLLRAMLDAAGVVEPFWFGVSAVLFVAGVVAAYPVIRYDIGALTWYPLWVWRHVRDRVSPDDAWIYIFSFLLIFNSVSLLVNVLGGFLVVVPPIFAFLLGMNLGVISFDEAGGVAGLAVLFLNPVAWIELPAAFVSLAAGTQLGLVVVSDGYGGALDAFPALFEAYIFVVLPLLIVAALLEATLIRLLGNVEHRADESEPVRR